MIRSTKNATLEYISRSILGQSIELNYGSIDGTEDDAQAAMSEIDWIANNTANALNTMSIVPSGEHNGPRVSP